MAAFTYLGTQYVSICVAPSIFLYFPSRAQRSAPLRLFIDVAKELVTKRIDGS